MEKKYELTAETAELRGKTLHRIRALRDFSAVKAGDLGGFVEGEHNLSHAGNAQVMGKARVGGGSWVGGYACLNSGTYMTEDVAEPRYEVRRAAKARPHAPAPRP